MKIDSYILTGFLGAGKTTILNELLKLFPHNTGIIENEFGSVNIDGSLIDGKFNEIYELTNGCICCSLDNELYTTLHQIVKNNHSIQNLFIETTGIADVGNIASLFKKQDVSEYYKLKSIICVVDCEQILDQINEVNEITRQIISSDLIILNKVNDKTELIIKKIQTINPFAFIVDTKTNLFDIKWLEVEHSSKKLFYRTVISEGNNHSIHSVLYQSEFLFNIEKLRECLQSLIIMYYHQIFRIKGYVIGDNNQMYLVQSTGQTIYISLPPNNVKEVNNIVFIGKNIELKTVERILKPAFHLI